jgi:hypothetical protein
LREISVLQRPLSSGIIVGDFFSFTEDQRKFFAGPMIMPNGKIKNSGSPNKPYFVPFQRALENITAYTNPGRTANFSFGLDRPMEKYATHFSSRSKTVNGGIWDGLHATGWALRSSR